MNKRFSIKIKSNFNINKTEKFTLKLEKLLILYQKSPKSLYKT